MLKPGAVLWSSYGSYKIQGNLPECEPFLQTRITIADGESAENKLYWQVKKQNKTISSYGSEKIKHWLRREVASKVIHHFKDLHEDINGEQIYLWKGNICKHNFLLMTCAKQPIGPDENLALKPLKL